MIAGILQGYSNLIEKQASAGQLASEVLWAPEHTKSVTQPHLSPPLAGPADESAPLAMPVITNATSSSVRPQYIIAFRANTTA